MREITGKSLKALKTQNRKESDKSYYLVKNKAVYTRQCHGMRGLVRRSVRQIDGMAFAQFSLLSIIVKVILDRTRPCRSLIMVLDS